MPQQRRLTMEQVDHVLVAAANGVSHRALARELSISRQAIDRIIQNSGYLDPLTPEQHLLANSIRDPDTGCLLWTKTPMKSGYAAYAFHGRGSKTLVHREAHVVWIGPIPPGFDVDHTCPVPVPSRHCIEPTHLEAVTRAVNLERMRSRLRVHGLYHPSGNKLRDPVTGRFLLN